MKNLMIALAASLMFMAGLAAADTYQVTFGWTDPTGYLPSDTPTYEAKYRVSAGAEVVLPGLTTPGGSATVSAAPGAPIEVSVRALNQGLSSAWTAWVTAAAPYPVTQPGEQNGLTITVVRTGP